MRKHTEQEIREWQPHYQDLNYTVEEVAKRFGVKAVTLVRGIRSLGIPTRASGFLPFNSRGRNNVDPIQQSYKWFYLHAYQRRAKRKGLEFSLPLDYFIKLVTSPCSYCGVESNSETRRVKSLRVPMLTVDRIDSKLGYTVGNCAPACKRCNTMKMDLSRNEFISQAKRILNWVGKL